MRLEKARSQLNVLDEASRARFALTGRVPAQPNHVTGRVPRCPVPLGSDIRYLIAARPSWGVLVLLLSLHSGLDALLEGSLSIDWLLAPVRLRDPTSLDLCSLANVILCRGTV